MKQIALALLTLSMLQPQASAFETERPMVDVQQQYRMPGVENLKKMEHEYKDLERRLDKIKNRLSKKKIPEKLRLQFYALKSSMQNFHEKLSGLLIALEADLHQATHGLQDEVGQALKSLYEEALLLYTLNKETSLMHRTKKSRLKNMLTQIRVMAKNGHFVILE